MRRLLIVLVYLLGVVLNVKNDYAMEFIEGGYRNKRVDLYGHNRAKYVVISLGSFVTPLAAAMHVAVSMRSAFRQDRA